jgi:hypothetical protein
MNLWRYKDKIPLMMIVVCCTYSCVICVVNNQLFQVPFFIAFLHAEQAIVVSIRGTFSLAVSIV